MTRFLPSQVPAQITAASRLRKTTCFNIRKNSCKISLTRTCKSDIIGNSLSGHGGIGRRVRFRFLWSQGCAGSSPVARTTKNLENTEFSRLFAFSFPLSHGGRGMHHLSILVHFQNADMAEGLLFLSLTNSISLLIILAVNSCIHFLYAPLPKQIL